MGKALVIVESPAKARTIGGLLGPDFIVESSIGHIRDLPRGADEVPAAYKGEDWARLGVDVDNGFKPLYVVSASKKSVVANLKRLLKDADELYLATDEDREGESIAWHLFEVLSPTVPVKRMVFHEITPEAIARAVEEWRDLDRRLVDAQEARRILDRLYGYEVSPVLWRKVMPHLSAGRVQSVATRMVVERERARMRFRSATWWGVDGTFAAPGGPTAGGDALTAPPQFAAALVAVDGTAIATGKDFSTDGEQVGSSGTRVLSEPEAGALVAGLDGTTFTVRSVTERPLRRTPAPPFMTSTLQQEAGRKLRFSAQRAMQVAQRLYEQGWITYMRTDSTTLSDEALGAARAQATELYGAAYVPKSPRRYERKVKNAQEAHEAIRPSGDTFRTPEVASASLSGDELRLYDLIWKRTIASQMEDARGTSAQVRLVGSMPADAAVLAGVEAEFAANGRVISFPGFLRAYVEGEDDPEAELADREVVLPPLSEGQSLGGLSFEAGSHATQPPARYTEASLVKAMEELGVGRPSTYASVISTIQDRGYVWKKGTALVPSFTAFAVVGLLERYFGELVDYGFTASMEDDLDDIANGRAEALPWLTRFYFGADQAPPTKPSANGSGTNGAAPKAASNGRAADGAQLGGDTGRLGLKAAVAVHLGEIDAREINSIPLGTDAEGREIVVRVGRYGPYVQRDEERASIPEDLSPDELTIERAEAMLEAPSGDRELGTDPDSGEPIYVKAGRFGPYVQAGEIAEGAAKPRTASLFASMSPATLTYEQALELLSIPRVVGADPSSGEEITALNGRYGPYLKRGTDTRSLTSEEQLLTVGLDEALAVFAQPKARRGRAAAGPLRELGADPETGLAMVVRDGRFGPYVTDGTTNASLRRGDEVESITAERAGELLAERRAAGPSTRGRKRATAKKSAPKKAAATKRPAKKAAAKKAVARKAPAKTKAPSKAAAPTSADPGPPAAG
jgi:DNA topoisomerase-1